MYPATAAAAPFLCQVVLDEASLWRAALAECLAHLSTGYDGTAQAVRDGVRRYVRELMDLWGTGDKGLDMALVALSAAFPVEAAAVVPRLSEWFSRSQPPLRTVLGLALGYHSSAEAAARQIVEDVTWVARRGRRIAHLPEQADAPRDYLLESYIYSPVLDAIHVARRLQRGAEEQTAEFSGIRGFLMTLMDLGGDRLINYPPQ